VSFDPLPERRRRAGITMSQRVLITGAASGIGAATVDRFAARGARVAALDVDETALARIQADARVVADVADERRVALATEAAAAALGGLDVLVCCAGVAPSGTILETSTEEWDRAFAVNVRGCFLMAKHVIPHMRADGRGGAIVNVSSCIGIVAAAEAAAYCASKAALIELGRAMAIDHAPDGIRVNTVCPGVVDTPMVQAWLRDRPDHAERLFGGHLEQRLIEPGEIADAIVFLASSAASSVIGETLVVDGGYTIR
jgi:NAD(P)-dependent dehydrogenase (short-subunit alcohol dehydrogenase family)